MAVARNVVVIGASSGGIEATRRVVQDLPAELAAAVVVVVHVAPTTPSVLPRILARAGRLPAEHARHGDTLEAGRIYVAPPDRHLVINAARLELSAGPRENHHRPAIDVTLRSAALSYRSRAVGVILSGALDDGTAGLHLVKRLGGLTLVQDPVDAAFPGMPASAIEIVDPHHVLKLEAVGPSLVQHLARASASAGRRPAPTRDDTGHAFSPASLFAGLNEDVERALWSAMRSLDESASVLRRLLTRPNAETRALRYRERLAEAERGSALIKKLLRRRSQPGEIGEEEV